MKPYYETELGKLYHGDCLEIMSELKPVDLVLTDPPYDKFTHLGALHKTEKDREFGISFSPVSDLKFVNQLINISTGWVLIFCSLEMLGKYQSIKPDKYVRGGVWDRICNAPQISGDRPAQGAEGIAIFHSIRKNMKWNGGGKAAIWRYMVERNHKKHETQKPSYLFQQLIMQFSFKNSIILDSFMGSGTTAIACERLNRRWIGIEIEEKYCEIAAKRIENERKQLKLFS